MGGWVGNPFTPTHLPFSGYIDTVETKKISCGKCVSGCGKGD